MKEARYTPQKLEWVQYMEPDPKSIQNVEDKIAKVTNTFQEKREKRKQVKFRINQNDLEKPKCRALIDGIPYQTLLNSTVHKFLNGTLVYK